MDDDVEFEISCFYKLFDFLSRVDGENARLTQNEYKLVSLLGKYAGRVLTSNNWQPAPITDETEKQQVLDFLSGRRKLPY